jgi:hypothetical protein
MKTSQRAARFCDLAAECSTLAITAPLLQMREQYRAMARHYLLLAETHGGSRTQPPKEALEGAKLQVWKEAFPSRLRTAH